MKVAIIGTGTMGIQIAEEFAKASYFEGVYLCYGRDKQSKDIKGVLDLDFERLVKKEKIAKEEADEILSKIVIGSKGNVRYADLVIESVAENLSLKQDIFRYLDGVCKDDCIFATNTSSLSIEEISRDLNRSLIGMHFFNPVRAMKLVEVVTTNSTPNQIQDDVFNIVKQLGKTPIEVKNSPGFIVNRLLMVYINEAINLYKDNIADIKSIDEAMKLGANHPMGPLELADLIGLDVVLNILNEIYKNTNDEKFKANEILIKLVNENKLGRKTKEGFYKY